MRKLIDIGYVAATSNRIMVEVKTRPDKQALKAAWEGFEYDYVNESNATETRQVPVVIYEIQFLMSFYRKEALVLNEHNVRLLTRELENIQEEGYVSTAQDYFDLS